MPKFKVEFEFNTLDHDADSAALVPGAIQDRFNGTSIHIERITVTKMKVEGDAS